MQRTTNAELKGSLKRLNQMSQRQYKIDGSYGRWQLVTEDSQPVSYLLPKGQLNDSLRAIIKYKEAESSPYATRTFRMSDKDIKIS